MGKYCPSSFLCFMDRDGVLLPAPGAYHSTGIGSFCLLTALAVTLIEIITEEEDLDL